MTEFTQKANLVAQYSDDDYIGMIHMKNITNLAQTKILCFKSAYIYVMILKKFKCIFHDIFFLLF